MCHNSSCIRGKSGRWAILIPGMTRVTRILGDDTTSYQTTNNYSTHPLIYLQIEYSISSSIYIFKYNNSPLLIPRKLSRFISKMFNNSASLLLGYKLPQLYTSVVRMSFQTCRTAQIPSFGKRSLPKTEIAFSRNIILLFSPLTILMILHIDRKVIYQLACITVTKQHETNSLPRGV